MVTDVVTDYNDLEDTSIDSMQLMHILKNLKTQFTNTSEGIEFQSKLEHLLKMAEEKSKDRKARREKYKDLIKGKFKLDRVTRIERTNDMDAGTGKEADFSSKGIDFTHETIKKLIEQGEKDAIKILEDANTITKTKIL